MSQLETQAHRSLRPASGADTAHGPWVPVRLEGGKAIHDGIAVRQQRPAGLHPIKALLRGWVCLIPCCLTRRSLLKPLGGYPTRESRTGEDVELFFRALLSGASLVHVPESLVLIRQHPSAQISAASEWASMRARDRVRLLDIVKDELHRSQITLAPLDLLLLHAALFDAQRELSRFESKTRPGGIVDALETLTFAAILRLRQIIRWF